MLSDEIRNEMNRLYAQAAEDSSVINVSRIGEEIAEKYGLDEPVKQAVMATLIDTASSNDHAVELHGDDNLPGDPTTGGAMPNEPHPTNSSEKR